MNIIGIEAQEEYPCQANHNQYEMHAKEILLAHQMRQLIVENYFKN